MIATRLKDGTYVNLSHVKQIKICRDNCKYPAGSDLEKFRWKILLIIDECDPLVWLDFETKEQAQTCLDKTVRKIAVSDTTSS